MLALGAFTGCSRDADRRPFVARVDESILTEEELAASRDSLGDIPPRDIINTWVTTELLYREAVRRGHAKSDALQRQLDAIKKRLVVNALLDEELYAADSSIVTDEAITAMYDSTKDAFRLKEDVVHMSYALFADRDAANTFRGRVVRSVPWGDAIGATRGDSLQRQSLLLVATRQYFTHSDLYPEELWKLARTLAKEEVSFALKTDAGYYVLVVHKVQRTGEVPDLAYVRNEIRERILIAQRRGMYEQLLSNLRSTHSVEIHITHADSTTSPVK